MTLAAVRNRMEMPNRRRVNVLPENAQAACCAVCNGLYRARGDEGGVPVCPACRTEAMGLAAVADPRTTA